MSSLEGIDIFAKVVECGSFTGAARLLNMPVTTVSGKVRALEARLGVTLMNRTTRKISVTEFGQIYYMHCIKAVEEITNAERALQSSQSEPEGLLRITAAPDIGHQVLPAIVKNFLVRYPKMRIELILTNRTLDLVGESVDIAIRPGPLKDSSLIARKFRETETQLWAASDYLKKIGIPKQIEDLNQHTFVHFKPFGNPLQFFDGNKTTSLTPKSKIHVDDLEAAKILVLDSLGIGVLPLLICEKEAATGMLIKVLPKWRFMRHGETVSQLFLVYPPHKFIPPKIEAFIKLATTLPNI